MRTATIDVFRFEELSESAKNRARDWFRSGFEYSWMDENLRSIRRFCDDFNVTLLDWSIGTMRAPSYTTNASNENFRGLKLREFDRNYMPTGYCLDCSLWVTFYDTFKKTGDAKNAFDLAVWQGFLDWQKDMEYQESDECIDENIISNEYEFTVDGKIY